jgi:hypothetical protein
MKGLGVVGRVAFLKRYLRSSIRLDSRVNGREPGSLVSTLANVDFRYTRIDNYGNSTPELYRCPNITVGYTYFYHEGSIDTPRTSICHKCKTPWTWRRKLRRRRGPVDETANPDHQSHSVMRTHLSELDRYLLFSSHTAFSALP